MQLSFLTFMSLRLREGQSLRLYCCRQQRGVVIYEDKFAYSHHATDPACGKLLNAFDLVRIHKFADDDDKKSFAAMMDFASKDDQVSCL